MGSHIQEEQWEYEEYKRGGGRKLSFERWREEREREVLIFRAPPEGELLRYGFTQLPTAAAKLRPLQARCTSPHRAVIGQYVDGYFVPDAVFLFDHRRGTREEQLRVITPDNEPHGRYADLFSEADVALMMAEAARYRWSEPKPFPLDELVQRLTEEPFLRGAHEDGRLFTATTAEGSVQLVQVRRDPATEDGTETSAGKYVSWNYTDTGWMRGEPDDERLAFSCGHLLADAAGAVVMVSEGISTPHRLYAEIEKVQRGEPSALLDAHPLREEILGAMHVGYLGGASWPQRADWDALLRARPAKVVIVPDNDNAGRGAVSYISRRLAGMNCTWLQLTSEFETGSDLSDPWPTEMFIVNEDGAKVYRADAPRFEDLEHPASWLTRQVGATGGRNPRPIFGLRPGSAVQWSFVTEMGEYYDTSDPLRKGMKPDALNRALRRFSDVKDTVALLDAARTLDVAALTYRPGMASGVVHEEGQAKLNQYVAPRYAVARPGDDVSLWIRFLEHLLPQEDDRREIMRWIATLVARQRVRMGYGLLLQSTETGTGKSTFAEIASRLVGRHNASAPSSKMVVDSDFNGWLLNKRLVTVHEIYEGGNWRAANKLKSLVTDQCIEANTKFQATYAAPLYAHFVCCSNHTVSLSIDNKDRRWLIPEVTETKLPAVFARVLYRWLDGPGLGAIARWATEFGDYVRDGEEAPMTERKQEQIEDSMSKAQRFAVDIAKEMAEATRPVVIGAGEVLDAARAIWGDAVKDSQADIAGAMAFVPGIVSTGRKGRKRHAGKPPTPSVRNRLFHDDPDLRIEDHLFDIGRVINWREPM